MSKRTKWVAWGLAAILASVLLTGTGVLFAHGMTLGNVEVQVRPTDRWTTGTTSLISCLPGAFSSMTKTTNLGCFAVKIRRTCYFNRGSMK